MIFIVSIVPPVVVAQGSTPQVGVEVFKPPEDTTPALDTDELNYDDFSSIDPSRYGEIDWNLVNYDNIPNQDVIPKDYIKEIPDEKVKVDEVRDVSELTEGQIAADTNLELLSQREGGFTEVNKDALSAAILDRGGWEDSSLDLTQLGPDAKFENGVLTNGVGDPVSSIDIIPKDENGKPINIKNIKVHALSGGGFFIESDQQEETEEVPEGEEAVGGPEESQPQGRTIKQGTITFVQTDEGIRTVVQTPKYDIDVTDVPDFTYAKDGRMTGSGGTLKVGTVEFGLGENGGAINLKDDKIELEGEVDFQSKVYGVDLKEGKFVIN
ncbi:MAG: hypothetical protein QGH47_04235, partial [Candidatus Woesearchaeota archaeon]|nr:hypothetical protein [Candidatus Woesearchaeota archaeon]